MLKNKKIVLGIASSIAIYKSCEMVRRLKELGAEVWVVMTQSATKLITPLTFQTLSGNPVTFDLFSPRRFGSLPHLALAEDASLLLVAPCTANLISKFANGIADDPLTTVFLSIGAKKLLVPAMNPRMWKNRVIQENVRRLEEKGCIFLGPVEGKLACEEEGVGRMVEPEQIVEKVISLLAPRLDLKGKHLLVTAAATREAIDAVRFISNRSSGKMGYALALAARERGATVTLISGPTNLPAPLDINPIKVETAAEMLQAVQQYSDKADVVIMAAAVTDFTPKLETYPGKIGKKLKTKEFGLELEPTPDILATISRKKSRKNQVLVGFALETENLIKNSQEKLKKKNLDYIVANDPSSFEAEESKVVIITKGGEVLNLPLLPKKEIAQRILDLII